MNVLGIDVLEGFNGLRASREFQDVSLLVKCAGELYLRRGKSKSAVRWVTRGWLLILLLL